MCSRLRPEWRFSEALVLHQELSDLSDEVDMRPLFPAGIFIILGIMCDLS
jgi:hypothetical protein